MDARALIDAVRAAGGTIRPGLATNVPPGLRERLLGMREEVRAELAGEVCVACGAWAGPKLFCGDCWCEHETAWYDSAVKAVRCGSCGTLVRKENGRWTRCRG